MKVAVFWAAVMPYLEQDGIINTANLQAALDLSEAESEEIAAHFCNERKLFRVLPAILGDMFVLIPMMISRSCPNAVV